MPRKIIYLMHILFIFTIAQSSYEYKIQDSIYRDVSPPIPGRRKIGGEKFFTRAILKETFPRGAAEFLESCRQLPCSLPQEMKNRKSSGA